MERVFSKHMEEKDEVLAKQKQEEEEMFAKQKEKREVRKYKPAAAKQPPGAPECPV